MFQKLIQLSSKSTPKRFTFITKNTIAIMVLLLLFFARIYILIELSFLVNNLWNKLFIGINNSILGKNIPGK